MKQILLTHGLLMPMFQFRNFIWCNGKHHSYYFSDFFYQDERAFPDKNYVDINAHELTHQWFGDYITAWSGSSHWLQESFATYYAKNSDKN